MPKNYHEDLKKILALDGWDVRQALIEFMKTVKVEDYDVKTRTGKQNNSIHKYLSLMAEALDREGHTMQDVVKAIKRAEIRPTMLALKEIVWKPLQNILLGKESTTKLEKSEVDKVYEPVNAFFGREFHIHIPFPHEEKKEVSAIESMGKGYEYPTEHAPADKF